MGKKRSNEMDIFFIVVGLVAFDEYKKYPCNAGISSAQKLIILPLARQNEC